MAETLRDDNAEEDYFYGEVRSYGMMTPEMAAYHPALPEKHRGPRIRLAFGDNNQLQFDSLPSIMNFRVRVEFFFSEKLKYMMSFMPFDGNRHLSLSTYGEQLYTTWILEQISILNERATDVIVSERCEYLCQTDEAAEYMYGTFDIVVVPCEATLRCPPHIKQIKDPATRRLEAARAMLDFDRAFITIKQPCVPMLMTYYSNFLGLMGLQNQALFVSNRDVKGWDFPAQGDQLEALTDDMRDRLIAWSDEFIDKHSG